MSWARQRFLELGERLVSVNESGCVTYAGFVQKIDQWREAVREWGVVAGDRVGLVSDHHIDTVALLQALIDTGCIVIPLSEDDRGIFEERLETACANKLITVAAQGAVDPRTTRCRDVTRSDSAIHPLIGKMIGNGAPGFVIFTSGSTDKQKAVLFDHARMTRAHRMKIREPLRTLVFYKLDHIAGLDTLFYVIFNGGTIVTCPSRQAADICACIERNAVELLPATPSFLTMLLMSGVYRKYDLSSLKVISYGTEVMPGSTLARLHQVFPGVALKQTYGLSELGALATKSRDSTSKWMKIGGQGVDVKVHGGTLWIKSDQAMVGYLNAPNPFDENGWYNTGDRVEVDGEYFQILGRESDVINVAGEKVFPAEIESFLLTLDNVRDVVVRKKKSPVVGQMVWAEFLLEDAEDPASFRKRAIEHCQRHLAPFKVPGLITIATTDNVVGSRFKKIRKSGSDGVAAAAP
jgi:acyl-CoA synthetase (AMP-forming)/AMP-acid ligase II